MYSVKQQHFCSFFSCTTTLGKDAKMESLFGSEWEEIMNISPLQGAYVKTGLATCLSWLDHQYLFTINGPFLGPIAKSYIVL